MAIAYQSVSALASGTGATLTIDKPSGAIDGDLLIAHVISDDLTDTFTAPAGWTQIQSTATANDTGGGLKMESYYKVASSEGSTYQWSFSVGAGPNKKGRIFRVDGQYATITITSSEQANDSASTTATGATVTPKNTDDLLVMLVGVTPNGASSSAFAAATDNPTWTEAYDNSGGSTPSLHMAYAIRSAVTATGNVTCTLSASEKSLVHVLTIAGNIQSAVPAGVLTVSGPAPGYDLSDAIPTGTLTLSGPTVTSTVTERNISNPDKSSSPSWVNPDKS